MERKKEATKPNSSASNNAHTTITTSLTFSRSLLPLSLSLSLSLFPSTTRRKYFLQYGKNNARCSWSIL